MSHVTRKLQQGQVGVWPPPTWASVEGVSSRGSPGGRRGESPLAPTAPCWASPSMSAPVPHPRDAASIAPAGGHPAGSPPIPSSSCPKLRPASPTGPFLTYSQRGPAGHSQDMAWAAVTVVPSKRWCFPPQSRHSWNITHTHRPRTHSWAAQSLPGAGWPWDKEQEWLLLCPQGQCPGCPALLS